MTQTLQNRLNAKLVRVNNWKMKKPGLQPGDKLPIKKSRRRSYPALTPEQQKLVEEHRWIAGRLAYSAKSLTNGHTGCYTKEDLESVGFLAVCVAATRYDPTLGWKFSTVAWNTARGWIQHALRDFSRMVRVPRWIATIRTEVKDMLAQGATYEEIADELGLEEHQILMCEESWQEIHSSYDHSPDESRPKEFIYEVDEVKAMVGVEVFEQVGDLNDKDIELLLLHVEGLTETDAEKEKAERLLQQLRAIVQDATHLG